MPIMRIGVTTEEQTVILAGPREDALGALAALASEVNAPEFIDQVPGNQFCWQEISIKGKSSQSGSLARKSQTSVIGTKQTCSMRWQMSAFAGKADSDQPLLTDLDL